MSKGSRRIQINSLTDDSYVKNLIADSGKIFATDRPFPVQKESRPPSAYMRTTAFPIALTPPIPLEPSAVPPKSAGRVMRNIFKRSKGAVHVLETRTNLNNISENQHITSRTRSCNASSQKKFESCMMFNESMVIIFVHLIFVLAMFCLRRRSSTCLIRVDTTSKSWTGGFIFGTETDVALLKASVEANERAKDPADLP